ncbi:MAG: SDR family oxidoreductase [Pseudomonas sp.]
MSSARLLVTAATGQLGRKVVAELLKKVPAAELAVAVRDAGKAADLAAAGVEVRVADYADPAGWDAALAGIERVLLVSSNAIGQRTAQHRNVIEAATRAGVQLIAYTSVLRADTSELALAVEHRETEALLRASGLPVVLLRNGWYTENLTAGLAHELASGVRFGSAGEGRFATATREDYAAAAAAVLAGDGHAGKTYELAGDSGYTLAEYAAEVSRLAGKPVVYQDLPQADFRDGLVKAGLPAPFAEVLADSDAAAARGALFDDGRQLSGLIGRPTTPLAQTLEAALAAL